MLPFCPGYGAEPFATLCAEVPGSDVFPADDFRLEWGAIFHRGRLDGTARVLVLGQDPGASEAIARRILVGVAGQRVQGLLGKLGLEREYVLLNAFVYSVYGQHSADEHRDDEKIAGYRNRWIDALMEVSDIRAVIAFGRSADVTFRMWKKHAGAAADGLLYEQLLHPTFPDAAAKDDEERKRELTIELLDDWNDSLRRMHPRVAPAGHALREYGEAFAPDELPWIPAHDLPPGVPPFMRSPDPWAQRTGPDAATKRRTVTVTIPPSIDVG
jgi:uracil-DNA glycosylase